MNERDAKSPAVGQRRTADVLTRILSNGADPAEVRCEAAVALAQLGYGAMVIDVLQQLTRSDDLAASRSAVSALAETDDARAVEPLMGVLRSTPELWQEAADALAKLHAQPALPELRQLAGSAPDARTRRGAIRVLGVLGDRLTRHRFLPRRRRESDLLELECPPL